MLQFSDLLNNLINNSNYFCGHLSERIVQIKCLVLIFDDKVQYFSRELIAIDSSHKITAGQLNIEDEPKETKQ